MLQATTAEKANRLRRILTTLAEQPTPATDYRRAIYLPFVTERFSAYLRDTGDLHVTSAIVSHLHTLLGQELELFLIGDSRFSQGKLFLLLTALCGEKALLAKQDPLRGNVVQFKRALSASE